MVKSVENSYLQRIKELTGENLRAETQLDGAVFNNRVPFNGSPARDDSAEWGARERKKRKVNYAEDQVDWELEQLLEARDDDSDGEQQQKPSSVPPPKPAVKITESVIRKTAHKKLSKKEAQIVALLEEELIPLRLNLNLVGFHYEDKLLWNLNDTTMSTTQFARLLSDDLSLPLNPWCPIIAMQLDRQIGIARQRKREWDEKGKHVVSGLLQQRGDSELRVLIKLELALGDKEYLDYFEWDLMHLVSPTALRPEDFAKNLARELSLSGEWITDIAHDIYEQLYIYRHVLSMHPESEASTIILDSFNKPLENGLRESISAVDINGDLLPTIYTPILRHMTPEEQLLAIEAKQSNLVNDPLWVDLANETTAWARLGQSDFSGHMSSSSISSGNFGNSRRESRRLVSSRYASNNSSNNIKFGEW